LPTFPRQFPRRGEIYEVDFNPARGSEQAGVRPAVVVSNDVNNQHSPVVIVAAMTKTIPSQQYPQNVHVPAGAMQEGTIYGGQLYTISKERLGAYRDSLDDSLREQLDNALAVSLGL
jgi:mRNA interferase MazF